MSDRPDAAALIAVAREALSKDVMPRLPSDLTLTGLMIARALDIAAREIAAGSGASSAFARARAAAGFADDAALVAALRDGPVPAELWDALLAEARARVAVANPKYS